MNTQEAKRKKEEKKSSSTWTKNISPKHEKLMKNTKHSQMRVAQKKNCLFKIKKEKHITNSCKRNEKV